MGRIKRRIYQNKDWWTGKENKMWYRVRNGKNQCREGDQESWNQRKSLGIDSYDATDWNSDSCCIVPRIYLSGLYKHLDWRRNQGECNKEKCIWFSRLYYYCRRAMGDWHASMKMYWRMKCLIGGISVSDRSLHDKNISFILFG